MAAVEDVNTSVSIWWVVLFVALVLGLAALAILAVEGYLVAPAG